MQTRSRDSQIPQNCLPTAPNRQYERFSQTEITYLEAKNQGIEADDHPEDAARFGSFDPLRIKERTKSTLHLGGDWSSDTHTHTHTHKIAFSIFSFDGMFNYTSLHWDKDLSMMENISFRNNMCAHFSIRPRVDRLKLGVASTRKDIMMNREAGRKRFRKPPFSTCSK